MEPKKQGLGALAHRSVWIVGPRGLQNDLLANLLGRKTGAKCFCGDSVTLAFSERHANTSQGIFLFDWLGMGAEGWVERVRPDEQSVVAAHLVALFNVSRGLGIEARSLRSGVRGFFYVEDQPEHIQKGVRAIFEGEIWVSREIMTRCLLEVNAEDKPHPTGTHGLTPREIEILSMIAIGATNEEVAEKLFISVNTVKTHVYNLFQKIKVPNRLQAALWAAKNLVG